MAPDAPTRVAGYDLAQIANAAIIADVARAWGMATHGALLAVMCAMGESSLRNIDYGDWETGGVRNPDGTPTTSIGLFQQQASWGSVPDRMDPIYATWKFLDALSKVRNWTSLEPTVAIHRVQINADPNHYAKYEGAARAVLAAIPDLRARGAIVADPMQVIEIPWQPGMYAVRALVDKLIVAGRPRINSAHRVYQDQKNARNAYLAGTGSPADDPDRPDLYELGHVRAIAVDIDVTPENVRRLSAAGLVRPFSWEGWHWRLPGDVRRFPLLFSLPSNASSASSGNATPIEEDDMYNDSDRKRDDKMAQEVHAVWQSIFEGGTSMPDGMRSIGTSLDNLTQFADRIDRNTQPVRDAVFDGGESMPDGNRSIGQSLADIAKAVGVKRDQS